MKPDTRIVFCVSGHGFGHASRVAAVITALRERAGPGLEIHVRSDAPAWIFKQRDPRVRHFAVPLDPGILQQGGLDLDLTATLAIHEKLLSVWSRRVEREAKALSQLAPALVVGDVPPLTFEAAARANLPCAALANFSWDWIFERYLANDARWEPIVTQYREAYSHADALLRLPLHGAMEAFRSVVDVPLIAHHARRPRDEVRHELGVDSSDERPLVLVSFGGFGATPHGSSERAGLDRYRFLGFRPAPANWPAEWIHLPEPAPLPHEELVNACDILLGKPGFGTVAEVLAHRRRFLYVSRDDFRETPVLVEGVHARGCARELARTDFDAGRWADDLDALCAQPAMSEAERADGAEVVADWILAKAPL